MSARDGVAMHKICINNQGTDQEGQPMDKTQLCD